MSAPTWRPIPATFPQRAGQTFDDFMELESVITVWPTVDAMDEASGVVTLDHGVYAPDVYEDIDADGNANGEPYLMQSPDLAPFDRWELMSGHSGQHGYSGASMHSSEYVGGGLERHIRDTPGQYAAVMLSVLVDDDNGRLSDDDQQEIAESAAGWALVRREIPADYLAFSPLARPLADMRLIGQIPAAVE